MLIGVVSDTHGDQFAVKRAAERLKDMDVVIHLGDYVNDVKELNKHYKKRILYVKGNCDFTPYAPVECIETFEGKNVFITHGHKYGVKNDLLNLKYKGLEAGADIVLYGHTHFSQITFEQGIWMINPGSAALPRNGTPTVAVIELVNDKIHANIIPF